MRCTSPPSAGKITTTNEGEKMYKSGEIYEVMEDFEKVASGRMDKEPKEFWVKGQWYQSGEINKLFDMYLKGWVAGKCYQRMES